MAEETSLKAVGWVRSIPMDCSLAEARKWTRDHLDSLKWAHDAHDVVDSVLLTVSELVTNAHVHARSDAQLILLWDEHCLHVTVHDGSSDLPAPRQPSSDVPGGRGLRIIDTVADKWETYRCSRGKDVTACFQPPVPANGT
ncbi:MULTISPECIES: ATP-binding protein [Streptomyces]|jgi:anti-sigma regulatory factor (Ser/Thr protein kinase)|uniref:ATP-binding protein n=1 Tax=Streptomyces doudnae TaxID=3075536 RepID=A0ABD5ERJ0_9ACTN|nr:MULTISPECIES: ATP-binding protein [unclassified Streptomyces]MDT0436299.1 ATP-binding protein [Streptomyces sp. DSM 41981]MYQ65254.1 ATP-binding protein [Streptomyces sp. SID4950]SCD95857.1 Anti-sigma regulatory factor (Ser/Thr protein kinase) [Streptomyces sp. SolWspMP-5a-2]